MYAKDDPSSEPRAGADAPGLDSPHCATVAASVSRLLSRCGHSEMARTGPGASSSLVADRRLVARQGNAGAGVVACPEGAEGTHPLGAQIWIST